MTPGTLATPEADEDGELDLSDLLLEVLPGDGTTIGNMSAREALSRVAERQISEEEADKAEALEAGKELFPGHRVTVVRKEGEPGT